MRKALIMSLALMLALVLVISVVGCSQPKPAEKEKVIRMGVLAPMTGTIATFGQQQVNATKMRIEELNAAGGILGHKIELFIQDDENKPELAASGTQKLIQDNKVSVIIGGMSSSSTMAGAPIAQRAGVIMISPWSTNPKATAAGDYIFRACFSDDFQGKVMANYCVKNLGLKKLGVIVDVGNDGSRGQGEVFVRTAKELGAEIVAQESFTTGDRDFKTQLTKVKAANPEIIVLPAYYAEAALIQKQAKELGIKVPFLGGDGWDSPDLVKIGGADVEGSMFTNHYSAEDPRPEVKEFREKYQKRFGEVPGAGAALSWDAVNLYKMGVEKAQSVDPKAVRDAMATLKDVKGLVTAATFSFDETRTGVKSAAILEVKNGQFVFKDIVNP